MKKITLATLERFNACNSGKEWFGAKFPKGANLKDGLEAALEDKRHDDANWLLTHIMTRKQRMAYAIFAAEQVIHIYERQYPDDKRPREAIEAAKAVLAHDTKENQEKLAAARDATWDAAWDAARAAARAAAWDAAWDAAWAAAWDAMLEKILRYGVALIEG